MVRSLIYSAKRVFFTFLAKRTIGRYEKPFRVNFYSRFTKKTVVGKNTNFNGIKIRGNGKVTIGDNFHSGKNILIINSYHKYDGGDSIPYDSKTAINKDVTIGDNVWIGDNVLILGGVVLEEGCIIQAGAVVVKSIPKYAIAGGNPAVVFKYRDIEGYENLKSQGRFW